MKAHDFEHRGTLVGGIEEDIPYPPQRMCTCGRKIARISAAEKCQRCIDALFAARFQQRVEKAEDRTPDARLKTYRKMEPVEKPTIDAKLSVWRQNGGLL